jgi:hypothetical protein
MAADMKNTITSILGVQAVLDTSEYLGLLLMVGCDKSAMFAYVKDHVW